MSLDVYLKGPAKPVPCECSYCGDEHTREDRDEFYQDNVTHNMTDMARAADLYKCCWRPEEIGITKAEQLIEPLRQGIERLKAEPERFKQFNPSNGWGDYDGFVAWLERYLAACIEYSDADVGVSR